MTNYEKIKQMSVDEMAEFFYESECSKCIYRHDECVESDVSCIDGHKQWLESEAEK